MTTDDQLSAVEKIRAAWKRKHGREISRTMQEALTELARRNGVGQVIEFIEGGK